MHKKHQPWKGEDIRKVITSVDSLSNAVTKSEAFERVANEMDLTVASVRDTYYRHRQGIRNVTVGSNSPKAVVPESIKRTRKHAKETTSGISFKVKGNAEVAIIKDGNKTIMRVSF